MIRQRLLIQSKVFALSALLALLSGCDSSRQELPVELNATALMTLAASGPALEIPVTELDKALVCTADLTRVTRDPVLLTPAFSTDQESFGWNYLRQLPALDIPVCSITVPDHGFGDLQTSAEYVVYAVRKMSALSGRKIILFGHQHGPLDELWALTFWPDIAARVSSFISLATPYNGTSTAAGTCSASNNCPPSVWQIAAGSHFLAALKQRELPAGPAYTSIATLYDELITPEPDASHREGMTNIVLQDICPGRLVEHFSILSDNVVYELVLDAIAHPGKPTDPSHLSASICSGPMYMPGTETPQSGISMLMGVTGFLSGFVLAIPQRGVNAEPSLRSYAATP